MNEVVRDHAFKCLNDKHLNEKYLTHINSAGSEILSQPNTN